jgi:rhomboid protease GluP
MPQIARVTPAVLTFIILNAAMFILELALGGSTNQWTLHRLGALEPFWVFTQGQYWRLLAALFLHYGAVHLIFNLYALFVLGPGLEKWIGTARFAFAYLLSGIGSTSAVLLLWRFGLTQADLLVGASGSIMGIVGTWAGVLLGHRHAPLARQRLMNIVFIVVLQSAFDIATPQVSMAAHWGGLISGFVLGLFLTPKHEL